MTRSWEYVLEATGTEGGIYYSYNAFNQQTNVRKSDGSCLESQYDAEYLRAGTVENGKECSFLYYNGELLAGLDQDQETAGRYILGYGVAAGENHKNEGYHFYHLDEQNSTTYITGMGGGIENRYQYDVFGVIRDRQEGFDNRILYTGQAHLRLHDATAGEKIKLSSNHDYSDLELMELYEKAYSTSSLNNIRGDLRNGSNVIAENVTPAEALEALNKWGVEHDEEFRILSEQRKQKENMAENKTETEKLGNCDSKK